VHPLKLVSAALPMDPLLPVPSLPFPRQFIIPPQAQVSARLSCRSSKDFVKNEPNCPMKIKIKILAFSTPQQVRSLSYLQR
jgi:hypothetical protein